MSWKVQLAPALLILILIGLGIAGLQTLRLNKANVDELIAGPIRLAELSSELSAAAWTAHAKLYRLAATSANEKDQAKIRRVAKETSAAVAQVPGALKAVEAAHGAERPQRHSREAARLGRGLRQAGKQRHRHGGRRCRFGDDVHQGRRASIRRDRQADRPADRRRQREQGARSRTLGPAPRTNSSGC